MARCPIFVLLSATSAVASPFCPFIHCASEMFECSRDQECRSSIECALSCAPMVTKSGDPPPIGGCVQACAMQKPSEIFNKISKCIFDNKCIGVPFPMPGHCKKPNNSKPIGLKNLEGFWWNIYGHDKTGDCQSCLFRSWYPEANSSKWIYNDNTLVVDHRNQYFNFTYPNEWDASQYELQDSVTFYWGEEHGLGFKEQWWLLDETPDYMQVYYCATDIKIKPGQQIEGGVILSKSKQIPDGSLSRIAEVYKPYYDFSTFCKNDNTCPTGTAPASQVIV